MANIDILNCCNGSKTQKLLFALNNILTCPCHDVSKHNAKNGFGIIQSRFFAIS
jgi:hypothetical protein